MQLAQMAHPVSVCHQWSMTGTLRLRSDHWMVSGSERSPARKRYLKLDRSYFLISSPLGSSRLMARKAVGAVKRLRTPCWEMIRQKTPASGVPTGLPSKRMVVQPRNSGP